VMDERSSRVNLLQLNDLMVGGCTDLSGGETASN
jgi:hypothetical protein